MNKSAFFRHLGEGVLYAQPAARIKNPPEGGILLCDF